MPSDYTWHNDAMGQAVSDGGMSYLNELRHRAEASIMDSVMRMPYPTPIKLECTISFNINEEKDALDTLFDSYSPNLKAVDYSSKGDELDCYFGEKKKGFSITYQTPTFVNQVQALPW